MNWHTFLSLLRLFDQTKGPGEPSDWEKIAIYLFIEAAFILAIIALIVRYT
jgi:hypothetical protein